MVAPSKVLKSDLRKEKINKLQFIGFGSFHIVENYDLRLENPVPSLLPQSQAVF